jgi:molybdopterin molybdotransferase
MIRFDEALARLHAVAKPLGQEGVALSEAAGRVLAEPVRAAIRAPAADVSTMDGYAVRASDVAELPAVLTLAGEALPGSPAPSPPPVGHCVRIFTGAPLPAGFDRVIIQEQVRREGDRVLIDGPVDESSYVRAAGSDFEEGDELVPAGRLLGPRAIVAAAAGDVGTVSVFRMPRVALLATGDELAAPGEARQRPAAIPTASRMGSPPSSPSGVRRWLACSPAGRSRAAASRSRGGGCGGRFGGGDRRRVRRGAGFRPSHVRECAGADLLQSGD